jgi:hypothetical protein
LKTRFDFEYEYRGVRLMAVFILLGADKIGDGQWDGYWWKVLNVEKVEDLSVGDEICAENPCGGRWSCYVIKENDKIAEAEDWESLDWKPVLLRPDSQYGYIAPDGRWCGCNYSDHYDLCRFVLKEENPEEHGWVKVFKSSFRDPEYYSRRKFLTDAQIKTLIDRGICDNEEIRSGVV